MSIGLFVIRFWIQRHSHCLMTILWLLYKFRCTSIIRFLCLFRMNIISLLRFSISNCFSIKKIEINESPTRINFFILNKKNVLQKLVPSGIVCFLFKKWTNIWINFSVKKIVLVQINSYNWLLRILFVHMMECIFWN